MSMFDRRDKKSFNVPMKTMGGEIWWETIRENSRYKLQMHQFSRHCRILTKDNIRIDNGSEESMLAKFEELDRREKAGLPMDATYPNICAPTLGGKYWWDTVSEENGFTLQQHKIDGHCRILDSDGIRLAHGSEMEMREIFARVTAENTGFLPSLRSRVHKPRATLGGHYCWDDVRTEGGYRMQRHKAFKNCRILDLRDNCIASGDFASINRRYAELLRMNQALKLPSFGDVIGVCRDGAYDHYGVYVNDDCVIEFADNNSDLGNPAIQETTLSRFLGGSRKCFCLVFNQDGGFPGKIYFSPQVPVTEKAKAELIPFISAFVKSLKPDSDEYLDYFSEVLDTNDRFHLYAPDETVQRAMSCLGQTNFGNGNGCYSLHQNNCEHFAIWCKTGLRMSQQAEGAFVHNLRALDLLAGQA